MVLHRDFLMRQIQQLVQVLLQVVTRRRQGDYEEAQSILNEGLEATFSADLDTLLTMEKDDFMALCSPSNAFHAGLAVALADLLREETTVRADERARWLYEASIATGAALSLDAIEWLATHRPR
ncbi:MAG: hypothetical protein EBR20_03840 [Bacteroidetes bacterium]|nr:hypothetical protein [Bacteroidota bacterium]